MGLKVFISHNSISFNRNCYLLLLCGHPR